MGALLKRRGRYNSHAVASQARRTHGAEPVVHTFTLRRGSLPPKSPPRGVVRGLGMMMSKLTSHPSNKRTHTHMGVAEMGGERIEVFSRRQKFYTNRWEVVREAQCGENWEGKLP